MVAALAVAGKVRPKSLAVKAVTLFPNPSCSISSLKRQDGLAEFRQQIGMRAEGSQGRAFGSCEIITTHLTKEKFAVSSKSPLAAERVQPQ